MAHRNLTQEEMRRRAEAELANRSRSDGDINSMMELSLADCRADTMELTLIHSVHPRELNVMGTMHGGLICWVLDSAMAVLLRACTGDTVTPTVDIHVNFLRPVSQGQELAVHAQILHLGRSTATLQARAIACGRICATATATFFRVQGPAE